MLLFRQMKGKGKISTPTAPRLLNRFDEIWTSEPRPEDQPLHKVSFRSVDVDDLGEYRMNEKTQFPGVHVFPGSAETLVSRGGITNRHSLTYSVSNISAKNYHD